MKKIFLSSLLAMAAVPVISQAASGTITLNGAIGGQTCTVNGNGSNASDFTVPMGNASSALLDTSGKVANAANDTIKLSLTNCSQNGATTPENGAVRARFEAGPTVDPVTHRLINSGTATNIQVALINTDGTDIAIGTGDQAGGNAFVPIVGNANAGTATLQYGHKFVATGPVVPGTIVTSVQYSLDFQ